MAEERPLGRRIPTSWTHVERYPFVAATRALTDQVERTLSLPNYRQKYDQFSEGACVGFASSWMMSIINRRLYDARWLWDRAKEIDDWPETKPGDSTGTSVRAAMDVLRRMGHCRVRGRTVSQPLAQDGILENRWATSVDDVRMSIAAGVPVTLGVNWYTNFDRPFYKSGRAWIGLGDLGAVRGGHAVCVYRASDRLQAVGIVNNWGNTYPLVLMPYEVLQRLLNEYGEATMVTDRV